MHVYRRQEEAINLREEPSIDRRRSPLIAHTSPTLGPFQPFRRYGAPTFNQPRPQEARFGEGEPDERQINSDAVIPVSKKQESRHLYGIILFRPSLRRRLAQRPYSAYDRPYGPYGRGGYPNIYVPRDGVRYY